MIDLIFYFGSDIIFIRIRGSTIMFTNSAYGSLWAPIDGIKISQEGVHKEFPDLINNSEWKTIAIQRFKEKINNLKTEDDVAKYITEDLKKYGYVPKYKQVQGFRRVTL